MDLDFRQTRALHLAGTVAFPLCYANTGEIWFENCSVQYRGGVETSKYLFVHEASSVGRDTTRLVKASHVAAVFFPGCWEECEGRRVYRFANEAIDQEEGEWFFGPDMTAERIHEVLKVDVLSRAGGAKGVVYVPESRAIFSLDEWAETALQVSFAYGGCDPR
jgi:hypothetical protein